MREGQGPKAVQQVGGQCPPVLPEANLWFDGADLALPGGAAGREVYEHCPMVVVEGCG